MVMPTGSFDIDPGTYGMGSSGQKWNFSVNAGIVLSEWGENGLSLTKWIVPNGGAAPPYSTSNSTSQNASVSYTFTVPTDGSWGRLFVSSMLELR